jgi:hypothetical protein
MTHFTSKLLLYLLLILSQASLLLGGQRDDKPKVTFGAFADFYYAYDFEKPASRDRAFTTQPARHNEFNVNLAFIETEISADRMRGRLALQTGTAVNLNYSAEVNNRDLAQLIQEAVAGYRVAENLWIDAGIYFSHIGFESWISRDNWTYTRSLCSDFSPFYQTGVKATWQTSPKVALQLHLLNGWQNIAENNGSKAIGMQVAFTPSDRVSLAYNNFLGNEQSDSLASRVRFFNDVVLKFSLSPSFQIAGMVDFGIEEKAMGTGSSTWYDFLLLGRYQLTSFFALAGRVEYFGDKDQVIVKTGTMDGFQVYGGSITADVNLAPNLSWRLEARLLKNQDAIYPTDSERPSKSNGFFVTSIALTL